MLKKDKIKNKNKPFSTQLIRQILKILIYCYGIS